MVLVRLLTTAEMEIASLNPPIASMDITQDGASARTIKALGITLRLKASVNEWRNLVKLGLALPIFRHRGSSGETSATNSTSTGSFTSKLGSTKRGIQSLVRAVIIHGGCYVTRRWLCLCHQVESTRVQYLHYRIELGFNVTAQGTIDVFSGDTRLFRDLRHSPGARHVANGFGDQSLVIGFERLGKIGRYHLGAVEIFSRIEWSGFCHAQSSNSLANFLARFMSAACVPLSPPQSRTTNSAPHCLIWTR